jgi:hypothetical protein
LGKGDAGSKEDGGDEGSHGWTKNGGTDWIRRLDR